MTRNATDAGGKWIMEEINLGTTQVVSLIRSAKGHIALQLAYHHILHGAWLRASTMAKTHKEGVARILGSDTLYKHIAHLGAINTLDGNSRTEGVANLDIMHINLAEASP